ncbi:MAG: hypothetical protein JWP85_797 [Rhodoglobus sp.]|nr:hypothetical protein [Rhodoglobus sp.]
MDSTTPAPVPPEPLPVVPAALVPPEPPPVVPPAAQPAYPPPAYPPPAYPPPVVPVVQPSAATYYTPVPTKPGSRRRTALIVTAIVVGSVAVLGGLVAGVIAVASTVGETVNALAGPPVTTEPPLTGEPGSPQAQELTACPDPCFGGDDVRYTIAHKQEFIALGLTETVAPWGTYDVSTVQAEYGYAATAWEQAEATPEKCFVVFTAVPMAIPFGDRPDVSPDPIHFTGSRQDSEYFNAMESSVRIFRDTASASAHMAAVDELVAECSHYDAGTGAGYWTADVTMAPAVDVPTDVAAVGWVEVSPFGRYYSFDVQRANLVVRTTLSTPGDISEEQFRTYIEHLAAQVGGLDPNGG